MNPSIPGKKRILIINPNTSERSTKHIERECKKIASPGTIIDAINPLSKSGFNIPSLLSYTDLDLCAVETIKIAWEKRDKYDGIIIACFSDPGLDAIKELLDIPVIGVGEAGYHIAAMLGHKFTVLASTSKWTPNKENYIKNVANAISWEDK